MAKRQPHRLPIDLTRWSTASRRAMSAVPSPGHYEDIHDDCIACGAPSTFTAEAQKQAFESRQAYIWQRRVLCAACFETRRTCERELRGIRSRWRASRAEIRRDAAMLQRWLDLLCLLPRYGARRDVAVIAMLRKTLLVFPASPGAGLSSQVRGSAAKDL